ncbi:MAG TPA: sigma 54-interacting transcriptional regulator [Candidatus Binatia bacterium]|jgi:Nif-specific regulatory protein|nr:sigma 54-interacting transcriptional regulator [Candidatus Binatia bacterium]
MDPTNQLDKGLNHLAEELLKICQKMSSERDLGALLDLIAREAIKLIEADRASLFLLDREKGELWSKVALGSEEILRFDARAGIAGAVAMTGQTINVEDAHQDPRFYKEIDLHTGYRTRSLLAVPLRNHGGEIIGTFEVLNKKTGTFGAEAEEILKALAAQAAIAIETAQLVEEMKRHRDQLQAENAQLWKEVEGRFSTQNIIGVSEKIQAVLRLIDQISNSSVNVLITGESGTGKELAAKAVHYKSLRTRRPFVALNCAALPESLVESELFGIERGVATGVERRLGKFEAAHSGTLFLDEVGDLSLTAQAKLLRVVQERVVEHVGGRKAIPVDVRILSATNKNLEAEIKKGTFREDLYYRLKVIHIQMPPLREIREDIPILAKHFLANYCREVNKESMDLVPQALNAFMNFAWPGNARELENEMKRLVISISGKTIREEDLSEAIRGSGSGKAAPVSKSGSLKDTVSELEKRMILEALQEYRQNQQHAARALGLSRQGLIKKIKRYSIRVRDS